ncbi:MAG TPA: hypothetical protein VMF90_25750 [Rhizobiaceae bacterium]|nr:hypothetical protein [Rhizobiaceae bacterium]
MTLKQWLKQRLGAPVSAWARTTGSKHEPKPENSDVKLREANVQLRATNSKLRETSTHLRDVNKRLREGSDGLKENIKRINEARETLRERVAEAEIASATMKDAIADERDARLNHIRETISAVNTSTDLLVGLGDTAEPAIAKLRELVEGLTAREKSLSGEYGTNFATNDLPRVRLNFMLDRGCGTVCEQRRDDLLKEMPTAFNSTRVLAVLDLPRFGTFDGYLEQIKKTGPKPMALRNFRKAENAGFHCKQINPLNYVPDIFEVNHSKGERQGGLMREPYNYSIEQLGGVPREFKEVKAPADPLHNDYWWGVFEPAPGHQQADGIVTDERLVGYIMLERNGNFARYRHILGHGSYLDQGVMYLLHFSVVRWLYETQPDFKYIIYAGWTELPSKQDSRPGLTRWKKKTLFEPAYAMEEISLTKAKMLDWINSKTDNREFPEFVLQDSTSAAAFYTAALLGVRDVIHLNNHGIHDVTLVDLDPEKTEEMRKVYPASWDYVIDDAYKVMDRFRAEGRRFDVILLDPWTHRQRSDMNRLGTLLDIANRYVVISLSANSYFRQAQVSTEPEDLIEHLQGLDPRIATVDVRWCTNFDGGMYWVTIGKTDPARASAGQPN